MSDQSAATEPGWRDHMYRVKQLAVTFTRKGFVVGIVTVWVVFWALIVRLQMTQHELLSAGVTGVLFVLPALIGLVAYLETLPDPLQVVPT